MSLDKVLFSKYKSVGIIADDRDSAELIFRDKVKFAYDNLPAWIYDTFQVKTDRKGELVFENNHVCLVWIIIGNCHWNSYLGGFLCFV